MSTPSSIVGVEQAKDRRRCVLLARRPGTSRGVRARWTPCAAARVAGAVGAMLLEGTVAGAQGRVVQVHRASEPEGRLLAYYSAAMVFSSLGDLMAGHRWAAGMEVGWIPALSESQRRPGIDKPEATNLSPVLPRARLAVRTPLVTLEGAWVPPVRVGDARANLWAVAASRPVGTWRGVRVAPRLSLVGGGAEGSVTCNAATMAGRGRDLAVYYARVCHGHDSHDRFEPRLVAGEVTGTRAFRAGRGEGWIAVGARVDRSRFDIGVRRDDGTRDVDHPILRLEDTRPHLGGGLRLAVASRLMTAVEWLYAPGSMATVRTFVAVSGQGVAPLRPRGAPGAVR